MRRLLTIFALLAALQTSATAVASRKARKVTVTVTAYCPCAKCCGRAGQPCANGRLPVAGGTVAGPRRYPLGTRIEVPGLGSRVIQDRLARRYDDRMDIFMASHAEALRFGKRTLTVTVYENP